MLTKRHHNPLQPPHKLLQRNRLPNRIIQPLMIRNPYFPLLLAHLPLTIAIQFRQRLRLNDSPEEISLHQNLRLIL